MSSPSNDPEPYDVVYSEAAKDSLARLVALARSRGLGAEAIQAVKEINDRLQLYPQFGEPVRDYEAIGITGYLGHIWQISFTYGVDEERRIVYLIRPPRALAGGPLAAP